MIRVLVVDDNAVFRGGIAALAGHQSDIPLVAEAANGQEAVQQFRAHRPGCDSDGLADSGNESGRREDRGHSKPAPKPL
jgi:chemotaxis response regulator CheB